MGVTGIRARTTWLAGLVLGVLDGLLLFEFPVLGVALVGAAVALVIWQRRAIAGLAGLSVGIGGMWLGVLLRARWSCDAFNAVPGQGCEMPNVDGYLVVGAAVLVAGLGLTGVAARRRRQG